MPRVNVSVKLSALYSQFDPIDPEGTSRAVRDRLRPILRAARSTRAFVNIDMEQYAFKDVTLRIFREVLAEDEFRDWPDVGIAIQAYLRDSRARPARAGRLGRAARHAGVGAARQGGVLGLRDGHRRPGRLAGAGLHAEVADRRELRDADALPAARTTTCCGRRSAATTSAASPTRWPRPSCWACRRAATRSRCSTAWPTRSRTRWSAWASASASTRPTASCCRAWRTWCAGCWRTRRTTSFLRASFAENVPEEQLLMNPRSSSRRRRDRRRRPHDERRDADGPQSESATDRFRNEPLADFSREENRAGDAGGAGRGRRSSSAGPIRWSSTARTCRRRRRDRLAQPVAHARGRRPVRPGDAGAGRRRRSQAAPAAFPAWRDTDPRRAGRLSCVAAAEVMRRRRFELAAWEVYECGKPWREADADVAEAIDFCEYYAREMLPPGRAAAPRRARRGERLLLRAARRRRRHRAVELPARHPVRHDGRGPRHRQHRRHEAGRAVGGHRRQADGGLPGGRPAAGRASTSCPASARRSARRWSSIRTSP